MLLPRPKAIEAGEEDPRAELVRRLLDYERIKKAAQQLDQLPQLGRDYLPVEVWIEQVFIHRLPEVDAGDLESAWRSLLARAKVMQHHRITREELSVREHMSAILRRLSGGAFVEFGMLFDPVNGVAVLIVSFLAVLELARESLIQFTQEKAFAPIYVRLAVAEPDAALTTP